MTGGGGKHAAITAVQTDNDSNNVGLAFEVHQGGTSTDPLIEAMRIDRNGNVGIGTTSPGAKFHVSGANDTTFVNSNVTMLITGTDEFDSGNAGSGIGFVGKHNDNGLVTTFGQIYTKKENNTSGDYDASLCFGTRKTGKDANARLEKMRITSDGNVGIGMSNPARLLHLKNNNSAIAFETPIGSEGSAFAQIKSARDGNSGYSSTLEFATTESATAVPTFGGNGTGGSGFVTRMLIDSAGNVGIGTTNPNGTLEVHSQSNEIVLRGASPNGLSVIDIKKTNSGDTEFSNSFYTGGTAGDFIFSNGRVGIGTTNPGAKLEIKTETTWGTYTNEALTISNIGSSGNVNQQHGLGRIKWETNNVIGASIDAIRNVPDDGNNIDLVFSTNPGGSNTTLTERMRINHEGAIIIQNTTAPTVTTNKLHANAGKLYWNGSELASGNSSNFAAANHTHTWSEITSKPSTFTPSTHGHAWSEITSKPSNFTPSSHNLSSHSDVTITSAQSNQILYYNGSKWVNSAPSEPAFISDKKYKLEIFPISDALLKVNSIRGANFIWSDDAPSDLSGKKDVGVIAQDIQKILPEAVEEKENGDLTVKYHRIIPLLIESIKELSEENKALKSRLDKIEGIS